MTKVAVPVEWQMIAALKTERMRLQRTLRLLVDAEQMLTTSQNDEGSAGDTADLASDLADGELDASLAARAAGRLADIEAALLRAAEGTFGDCLACGQPVGDDRLRALSWTPYCRSCAGLPAVAQRPAPAPAALVAHMR